MPDLKNKHLCNQKKRFPENILCRITAELDTILPKIFRNAKITPVKYQLVENTKSSVCISVKGADTKKYFVKICPDDSIATEIFWRKKAHENNIPTPRIIFADTSQNKVPFRYEVLEFIEGRTLEYRYSDDPYDKYTELIGQELRKLHSIPADGFGRICAGSRWSCKTWHETLERHIDISRQEAARELFSAKELAKLHNCVFDKKLDVVQSKFLHGDVSTSNFIFSKKRNEIIFLDPGATIGGDPMMDLACASIPSEDNSFFRGIKDGYEAQIPLTCDESYRLEKLRLLCLASAVVGLYTKKDMKYAIFKPYAKDLLAKL